MLIHALLAGASIALLALLGSLFFGKSGYLTGTHRFILPVAVGVFLGIVFFELVPETIEGSHEWGPLAILVGYLGFYLLSHFLETYHHHHFNHEDTCKKNGARKLLIGDGIHNIADGVVIASAFMISPATGILVTAGIALHEIPQEIAEYGVLIHAGYNRAQALFYNFLSASSVFIGILGTYAFIHQGEAYLFVLTGIAAGNLLYIATADLIPELKHSHRDHFFKTFFATILGVALIGALITYTHEKIEAEAEELVTQVTEHT